MHEHTKELKLLYRRTQIGSSIMLAQDHTENRDRRVTASTGVGTVCRFVKVLKELSLRLVFDLRKENLKYYYKLYLKMIFQC